MICPFLINTHEYYNELTASNAGVNAKFCAVAALFARCILFYVLVRALLAKKRRIFAGCA